MQDHKQRFLFPDSDIRGELVQVESSVSRIIEGHNYPLPVQGLIGEAVAAVALLASTLKFKGRLALQAQGHGPVSLLLAECTNEGELRAVARHSEGQDWSQGDIRTLIGDGNMVITIIPEQGQQYQGIVPLTGDTLAQAGEVRDGGDFYERMGRVACWNAVMDENQYMVRKWNEFIAA